MSARAIVVAVVLALVPAAALAVVQALDESSRQPHDASTDLPIPPVSPSATRSGTPTPSTSTPTPTPTRAPLPRIAPDAPRRLVAGNLVDTGFDEATTDVDASSDSEATRLESRGSPGSPGTDTVVVLGRVLADGDSAFANLPRLEKGARVTIRTDSGTLTYTVTATRLRPEAALAGDPLLTARHRGRLVLVGIRYDDAGDRLDRALVVTAQLSGAARA